MIKSQAVSITAHLHTSNTDFQCLGHTLTEPSEFRALKVPGLRTENGQKCSVKRWTLLALNGRHVGYIAEEEEPFWQLFSLESWLTDALQITSAIIAGYNNCVI